MQRLALFCDWHHWVPQRLLEALAARLEDSAEQRIVAVCIPRPHHWRRALRRHYRQRMLGLARAIYYGDGALRHRPPAPMNLQALSERYGFQVFVASDANSAEFLDHLSEHARADVALSIFWLSRFKARFRSAFSQVVNYHNGLFPDYRGLKATPWSIYRDEAQSGFTFHRVNAALDLGNVLVSGKVPVFPHSSVFDVEWRKTDAAVEALDELLRALRNADPGTPQQHPERYNDSREIQRLQCVEAPGEVAAADLLQRIRSFGFTQVRIGGELVLLSGLGRPVPDPRHFRGVSVTLRDGTWRIKRADWLAHRLRRRARP